MGAINKDNYEDRIAWAKDYTEKASANKMSCFLWDNNGTKIGSENFAMIDRRNQKFIIRKCFKPCLQTISKGESTQNL